MDRTLSLQREAEVRAAVRRLAAAANATAVECVVERRDLELVLATWNWKRSV